MIKYIILGIVQGLTEFLPVSSSGHLAVLQRMMGLGEDVIALSVVLHIGTALSVIVFFFKDIVKLLRNAKLLMLVAVVTIITGVIGIGGRGFFEGLFNSPKAVGYAWIITGLVLLLTKNFGQNQKTAVGAKDAVILGLAQGLAIVPGISRSGITIATLLFRRIEQETSFRFSFLAAIPAIFGAALLEARPVDIAFKENLFGFSLGCAVSFLSGILALWMLKGVMRRAKLHYFGYYCIIIAILTLLFIQ